MPATIHAPRAFRDVGIVQRVLTVGVISSVMIIQLSVRGRDFVCWGVPEDGCPPQRGDWVYVCGNAVGDRAIHATEIWPF